MEQIAPLLEKLAEQLGTTSEYLWAVLLRQAPVNVLVFLIHVLLFFVLTVAWIHISKPLAKTVAGQDWINEAPSAAGLTVGWGTIALLWIWALASFENAIVAALNPEYWALQQVLDVIK